MVHPVFQQNLIQLFYPAAIRRDPQPQIVVLRVGNAGAIAEFQCHGPAHHHPWVGQAVSCRKQRPYLRAGCHILVVLPVSGLVAPGVDQHDLYPDHVQIGPRIEIAGLLLDARGKADIVGVHAGDVLAARQFDAGIERGGDTAVNGISDQPDALIGEGFNERHAVIG